MSSVCTWAGRELTKDQLVDSYSKDYPTIPFIPTSWGGADAANKSSTPYGANVTAGVMTTSSGPRRLKPGDTVQFLFDVAFTPSKPLDLSHHWRSRYLQIGYGVPYTTPQAVAAQGVTVATLHQGIGGIHNGSMVNPYISALPSPLPRAPLPFVFDPLRTVQTGRSCRTL